MRAVGLLALGWVALVVGCSGDPGDTSGSGASTGRTTSRSVTGSVSGTGSISGSIGTSSGNVASGTSGNGSSGASGNGTSGSATSGSGTGHATTSGSGLSTGSASCSVTCGGTTPYCIDGACRECGMSSDCGAPYPDCVVDASSPYAYRCVQCLSSSECGAKSCDPSSFACVANCTSAGFAPTGFNAIPKAAPAYSASTTRSAR